MIEKRLLRKQNIIERGKDEMKTIKDKYLLVAADFAGYPLKEAVVAHLKAKGWKITDVGVKADSDPDTDTDLMFHRIGLRAGNRKKSQVITFVL